MQQIELRPSVHLSYVQFEAVGLSCDLSLAPGEVERRPNGHRVSANSFSKLCQLGDPAGFGPATQLSRPALRRSRIA